MRLTRDQQQAIREEAARIFGQDALVRLFGSRVDDQARGGDIDLHIEAEGTARSLLDNELEFRAQMLRKLGDRRIDVVVHRRGAPLRPIDFSAHETGVQL